MLSKYALKVLVQFKNGSVETKIMLWSYTKKFSPTYAYFAEGSDLLFLGCSIWQAA